MRSSTSGAAFAAANAAMIRGVHGASTVQVLLADCLELLGADTAGVLVQVGAGVVDESAGLLDVSGGPRRPSQHQQEVRDVSAVALAKLVDERVPERQSRGRLASGLEDLHGDAGRVERDGFVARSQAAGALGGFSAVTLGAVFRNHELRHGLPGLEFVAGERPSSRP